MKSTKAPFPWLIGAVLALLLFLALGCWPWCYLHYVSVNVTTDEFLLIEGEPDTGDEAPALRVQPISDTGEVEFGGSQESLVYIGGERYTLVDELYMGWNGQGRKKEVQPEDYVLAFDLVWNGADDSGDDTFPTVRARGDQSEVELWNGWTVSLDWGDPSCTMH